MFIQHQSLSLIFTLNLSSNESLAAWGVTVSKDRKWLEALNFGFKKRYCTCTIPVAKTTAMVICEVTPQLICIFDFALEKNSVFSWRDSNNPVYIKPAVRRF